MMRSARPYSTASSGLMERDRFMSPEEAVEYGLADRIIESHQLPKATLGFREG